MFYQTNENSPVPFVSHEIKCVTKEKTPFKITFKEIEKDLPLIIQDVARLEHLKGQYKLELISRTKLIYNKKGRLQQTINEENITYINDEAAVILEIKEQGESK